MEGLETYQRVTEEEVYKPLIPLEELSEKRYMSPGLCECGCSSWKTFVPTFAAGEALALVLSALKECAPF